MIFDKHGVFKETSVSIFFEGLDGMDKMTFIMEKLLGEPFTMIADEKVAYVKDYVKGVTVYANGDTEAITLPKTNAIYYGMENGDWICIRPSGTEPKLKIYTSISRQTLECCEKTANSYNEFIRSSIDRILEKR